MMKKTITALIGIIVIGSILSLVEGRKVMGPSSDGAAHVVTYSCTGGKTITAAYTDGNAIPASSPNQPPTPTGSVLLNLSDGREMTLPQTISASGIRYANKGESIIFWSKGKGAFMTENGQETYSSCVEQPAA